MNKPLVQFTAIICISAVVAYVVFTLGVDGADAKKSIVSDIVMFGMAAFGVAKVASKPQDETVGEEKEGGGTNG
jgi:hypothetical protein